MAHKLNTGRGTKLNAEITIAVGTATAPNPYQEIMAYVDQRVKVCAPTEPPRVPLSPCVQDQTVSELIV